MNDEATQYLADAWLDFWENRKSGPEPELLQEKLSPACECDPEELWQFIRTVYRRNMSERVFAVLAAGPVEDLLSYYGPEFIDRVETEARQNPRFRELLGGVWRSTITADVWARLEKFRGPSW